mmetsp:Transcript_36643/g.66230  ORF Transcript_36643/g.66230 Transcript_36643/m.66230 type:complete len:201 (+) Transcript_36643:978-1580(+)
MLVVADQSSLRIGRKGGLSGAAEAEEDTHVPVLAFVRAGVHGEKSHLRQEIVHDGEDALLHLTCVFRAEDDDLLGLEVDRDGSRRGHAFGSSIGWEGARVVDGVVWLAKVLQLLWAWADEHVVHEQSVVGPACNDADLVAVLRIPAGVAIEHVQALTSVEIINSTLTVDPEGLLRDLDVDAAPPDVSRSAWLVHNALVHG